MTKIISRSPNLVQDCVGKSFPKPFFKWCATVKSLGLAHKRLSLYHNYCVGMNSRAVANTTTMMLYPESEHPQASLAWKSFDETIDSMRNIVEAVDMEIFTVNDMKHLGIVAALCWGL